MSRGAATAVTVVAGLATVTAVVASCASGPPRRFESRVELAPLMARLSAAGGSAGRALRVHNEEELAGLKPGQRYKYVVTEDGAIVVAPRPANEPGNEYVHPILGGGLPVRTAGYLRYERRGVTATGDTVVIDQDSKAYCPTFGSLGEGRAALARIGIRMGRVRLEDHPPVCVELPAKQ